MPSVATVDRKQCQCLITKYETNLDHYIWNSIDEKTESTRKLSNFNFQWAKTLYQNNYLNNIVLFFTLFKG